MAPPAVHLQESPSLFTPINFVFIGLFVIAIYYRLKPKTESALPDLPAPVVFKTYTPPELVKYNGTNGYPVFLSIRGRIFDVSPGRNFYGPGGPYENFAGRDATRGLACGSFDTEVLTKDLQGPLDNLEGLGSDEWDALKNWEETFTSKYLVVGELASVEDARKKAKA